MSLFVTKTESIVEITNMTYIYVLNIGTNVILFKTLKYDFKYIRPIFHETNIFCHFTDHFIWLYAVQ